MPFVVHRLNRQVRLDLDREMKKPNDELLQSLQVGFFPIKHGLPILVCEFSSSDFKLLDRAPVR